MSVDFLSRFGFNEDPFASTNAADEPLIESYFVDPPFFPAVVRNPSSPKSNVVFAPRGAGKTAQKIMIEKRSAESARFLCISYDRFPTEGIRNPGDGTSEYHITNITRILLIAVLVEIDHKAVGQTALDEIDRQLLVTLSRSLLGSLSSERFKQALDSIKSLGNKTSEAWQKYGGIVISLVNAISTKYGIGKIEAPAQGYKPLDETIRFRFETLAAVALKLGFESIYILVDRADELAITTQHADRAFEFLRPILTDLPLLETPGVAFKFFLWDQMKEPYQEAGGRPDRLIEYSLDWSVGELKTVLHRRL